MLYFNEEMFSGEIGQVGTQFDGLGHVASMFATRSFYNGLTLEQVGTAYGLRKLGIEKLRAFFTRGC